MKPLSERTGLLSVLLWLLIAASTLWLLAIPFVYFELASMPASLHIDSVDTPVLIVAGLVALVLTPLSILVGVVFLMWVYRVTANLRVLTESGVRFTPGWSVGWYFIPILGLVRPYQGMTDIWRSSHGGSSEGQSVVRLWWFLSLMAVIVARIVGAFAPQGETVGEYARVLLFESPGYALDVALYVVTLRMIALIGAAYAKSVNEWALEHPAIPAGWYPDPAAGNRERFWDGSVWECAVRDVIGPGASASDAPEEPASDTGSG